MGLPVAGQPHPDVAIVKNVMKEMKAGETIPYEKVAKALQMKVDEPAFMRRCSTARKQLERPEEGGVVIVCVKGGFMREEGLQTASRVGGRETRGVLRKTNRCARQLNTIDVTALDQQGKCEVFGLMAQLAAIRISAGKPARQKLIAAATATSAEIATQKALEILQERNT